MTSSRPEVGVAHDRPLLDELPPPLQAGSRDANGPHVDLLITIRDEDSDGGPNPGGVSRSAGATAHRGSPVGSGHSCCDEAPTAPASGVSGSGEVPTRRSGAESAMSSRPRSVAVDDGGTPRSKYRGVGFLLRKQNSASTIPLRSQARPEQEPEPEAVLSVSRTSCSTLVVDIVGDGEVTARAADLDEGSTRSLPLCNNETSDAPTQTHCESAL